MPSTKRPNAKRRLFGKVEDEKDENHRIPQHNASSISTEKASQEVVNLLQTPQKKRKVAVSPSPSSSKLSTPSLRSFFSPAKGKAVVTPDKEERVDDNEDDSRVKPANEMIVTPVKAHWPTTPLNERLKKAKEEDAYVPTYIHKNLSYQREGTASLPPTVKRTFELVRDHYEIPENIEQDRSYGPLSGSCYEERVIRAYNLSMLEPKGQSSDGSVTTGIEICSHCATVGHKRNECPDLI